MKMSMRKIFSIVMAGIAFLMFVFSFLDYVGTSFGGISMWNSSYLAFCLFQLFIVLALIALCMLHLFMNLKEKWFKFANYGVGFITLFHLSMLFTCANRGMTTYVGLWFEFILGLGLGACSVIWYFMSDEPFAKKPAANAAPILGYDQKTGQPIYAKITGYDPKTGQPIYEK